VKPHDSWRASPLVRALSAEALKLKGTLALWMCLIAPGVVIALQVLQLLARGGSMTAEAGEPWPRFVSATLALWGFLMLPLFVTLQAALLGALEHSERQWKHLLALPMSRSSHYLAKAFALLALLLLATLALCALLPVLGQLLKLRPALGFHGWPELGLMVEKALQIALCAQFMLAIQLAIALHWRSFTVAVAVGMSATVMGFLIGQSPDYGPWFPWTMAIQPVTRNPAVELVMLASLIGALAVSALSIAWFKRRDFLD
jgi:hypothetical protein